MLYPGVVVLVSNAPRPPFVARVEGPDARWGWVGIEQGKRPEGGVKPWRVFRASRVLAIKQDCGFVTILPGVLQ